MLVSNIVGEDSHFDDSNIFQMGWFNHQVEQVEKLDNTGVYVAWNL